MPVLDEAGKIARFHLDVCQAIVGAELQFESFAGGKSDCAKPCLEDRQIPFFVQWIKNHHPSTDGKAVAKIVKIEIAGDESTIAEWLGSEVKTAVGSGIEIEWVSVDANDGDSGIVAVEIETSNGKVRLD